MDDMEMLICHYCCCLPSQSDSSHMGKPEAMEVAVRRKWCFPCHSLPQLPQIISHWFAHQQEAVGGSSGYVWQRSKYLSSLTPPLPLAHPLRSCSDGCGSKDGAEPCTNVPTTTTNFLHL